MVDYKRNPVFYLNQCQNLWSVYCNTDVWFLFQKQNVGTVVLEYLLFS